MTGNPDCAAIPGERGARFPEAPAASAASELRSCTGTALRNALKDGGTVLRPRCHPGPFRSIIFALEIKAPASTDFTAALLGVVGFGWPRCCETAIAPVLPPPGGLLVPTGPLDKTPTFVEAGDAGLGYRVGGFAWKASLLIADCEGRISFVDIGEIPWPATRKLCSEWSTRATVTRGLCGHLFSHWAQQWSYMI